VHPHYFLRGKFTTDDIFTFADSFMGGGTEFTGPLTKAAEIIENESFRNADVLFLTDGECDVDQEYADLFKEKRTALNFTANAIILDKDVPGSASSLDKLCDRVYRLSGMTADEVAEGLISKAA
jgi:uncharacterized protein with von Willebrand factor type A (vWA) domain